MYIIIFYWKNIILFLGGIILISYILIVSYFEHNVMGDPVLKDPLLKYKIITKIYMILQVSIIFPN